MLRETLRTKKVTPVEMSRGPLVPALLMVRRRVASDPGLLLVLAAISIAGCARKTVESPPPAEAVRTVIATPRPRPYSAPRPVDELETQLDLSSFVPPLPEEFQRLVGCYRLELPPLLGGVGHRTDWTGTGRSIVIGLTNESAGRPSRRVVKVDRSKAETRDAPWRFATWRFEDGEARISLSNGWSGYSFRLSRSSERVEAIAQFWDDAYVPNEWWEVEAEATKCPRFPAPFLEATKAARAK